jgi:hypothetical protein
MDRAAQLPKPAAGYGGNGVVTPVTTFVTLVIDRLDAGD